MPTLILPLEHLLPSIAFIVLNKMNALSSGGQTVSILTYVFCLENISAISYKNWEEVWFNNTLRTSTKPCRTARFDVNLNRAHKIFCQIRVFLSLLLVPDVTGISYLLSSTWDVRFSYTEIQGQPLFLFLKLSNLSISAGRKDTKLWSIWISHLLYSFMKLTTIVCSG